jgi:hypothetical protein
MHNNQRFSLLLFEGFGVFFLRVGVLFEGENDGE